jgi:hypothetical protein
LKCSFLNRLSEKQKDSFFKEYFVVNLWSNQHNPKKYTISSSPLGLGASSFHENISYRRGGFHWLTYSS